MIGCTFSPGSGQQGVLLAVQGNTVYRFTRAAAMWEILSISGGPIAAVTYPGCAFEEIGYLFGGDAGGYLPGWISP
jgi:hypothetical protein